MNSEQYDRCQFRQGVFCNFYECSICGWNPSEEARRKAILADGGTLRCKPNSIPRSLTTHAKPHTMEEVLAIVRMAHRDFGIGTMSNREISDEFHISTHRVGEARKLIHEELKQRGGENNGVGST
jgi:hypothetical protein